VKKAAKIAINALIAGGLVFTGSAITELTKYGFTNLKDLLLGLLLGFLAAIIVFLTKMQTEMADDKKGEVRVFDFI